MENFMISKFYSGRDAYKIRHGGSLSCPTWAPDKRKLAINDGEKVILLDSQGSVVLENKSNYFNERLSWSPDSRHIALEDDGGIYLLSIETNERAFLADGCKPIFSPLGNSILFCKNNGLMKLDLSTHYIELMTDHVWHTGDYDWSPLGDQIVFVNKETEIILVDSESKLQKPLFKDNDLRNGLHVHFGNWPRWSPNGKTIAYRQRTDISRIFAASPDGSDVTAIVNCESSITSAPVWSDDSQYVAFVSGFNKINVSDLGGAMVLEDIEGTHPSWGPDKNKITFINDNHVKILAIN
jgi:hypothetical protein